MGGRCSTRGLPVAAAQRLEQSGRRGRGRKLRLRRAAAGGRGRRATFSRTLHARPGHAAVIIIHRVGRGGDRRRLLGAETEEALQRREALSKGGELLDVRTQPEREAVGPFALLEARLAEKHRSVVIDVADDAPHRLVDRPHRLLLIPLLAAQKLVRRQSTARSSTASSSSSASSSSCARPQLLLLPLVEVGALELDLGVDKGRQRQAGDDDAAAGSVRKVHALGEFAAADREEDSTACAVENRGLDCVLVRLDGGLQLGGVARLDDERLELLEPLEDRRPAVRRRPLPRVVVCRQGSVRREEDEDALRDQSAEVDDCVAQVGLRLVRVALVVGGGERPPRRPRREDSHHQLLLRVDHVRVLESVRERHAQLVCKRRERRERARRQQDRAHAHRHQIAHRRARMEAPVAEVPRLGRGRVQGGSGALAEASHRSGVALAQLLHAETVDARWPLRVEGGAQRVVELAEMEVAAAGAHHAEARRLAQLEHAAFKQCAELAHVVSGEADAHEKLRKAIAAANVARLAAGRRERQLRDRVV